MANCHRRVFHQSNVAKRCWAQWINCRESDAPSGMPHENDLFQFRTTNQASKLVKQASKQGIEAALQTARASELNTCWLVSALVVLPPTLCSRRAPMLTDLSLLSVLLTVSLLQETEIKPE